MKDEGGQHVSDRNRHKSGVLIPPPPHQKINPFREVLPVNWYCFEHKVLGNESCRTKPAQVKRDCWHFQVRFCSYSGWNNSHLKECSFLDVQLVNIKLPSQFHSHIFDTQNDSYQMMDDVFTERRSGSHTHQGYEKQCPMFEQGISYFQWHIVIWLIFTAMTNVSRQQGGGGWGIISSNRMDTSKTKLSGKEAFLGQLRDMSNKNFLQLHCWLWLPAGVPFNNTLAKLKRNVHTWPYVQCICWQFLAVNVFSENNITVRLANHSAQSVRCNFLLSVARLSKSKMTMVSEFSFQGTNIFDLSKCSQQMNREISRYGKLHKHRNEKAGNMQDAIKTKWHVLSHSGGEKVQNVKIRQKCSSWCFG